MELRGQEEDLLGSLFLGSLSVALPLDSSVCFVVPVVVVDCSPTGCRTSLAGAISLPPLAPVLPPGYKLLGAPLKETQLSSFLPFPPIISAREKYCLICTDRHIAKQLGVNEKHTEANFNIP